MMVDQFFFVCGYWLAYFANQFFFMCIQLLFISVQIGSSTIPALVLLFHT